MATFCLIVLTAVAIVPALPHRFGVLLQERSSGGVDEAG